MGSLYPLITGSWYSCTGSYLQSSKMRPMSVCRISVNVAHQPVAYDCVKRLLSPFLPTHPLFAHTIAKPLLGAGDELLGNAKTFQVSGCVREGVRVTVVHSFVLWCAGADQPPSRQNMSHRKPQYGTRTCASVSERRMERLIGEGVLMAGAGA